MTIASQIIERKDLTERERRNNAEFWAVSFEWKAGSLNASYTFKDGSHIICSMDEFLEPIEFVEV